MAGVRLLQVESIVLWLSEELKLCLGRWRQIFAIRKAFSISNWNPVVSGSR